MCSIKANFQKLSPIDSPISSYPDTLSQIMGLCEVLLVIWSIWYLIIALMEMRQLGFRLFLKTLKMSQSR